MGAHRFRRSTLAALSGALFSVTIALFLTTACSGGRAHPTTTSSQVPSTPQLLEGGGFNALDLSFLDSDHTARLDASVLLSAAAVLDRDFTIDGGNVRATLTRGSHLDELRPEPTPTVSPHPAVVSSSTPALSGTIHITAHLIDPNAPADCRNLRTTAVLTNLRFMDGTTIDHLTAHTDEFGCYAA